MTYSYESPVYHQGKRHSIKKKGRILFLSLTINSMFFVSIAMDDLALAPRYKKWLEEEVVYIITPLEKKVFLQLKSDRERDQFIEAFWRQRDPVPLTEQNEFKEEHYKRIDYANRHFGRLSSVPGWKTDMGKIYIILGPPISIQRFEDYSFAYPVVVWNYNGMSPFGLPDSFNIVFFRRFGIGDFQLYSPNMDGPQGLLAVSGVDLTEPSRAYEILHSFSPSLAQVSLSLIPGESLFGNQLSLESERLLLKINSAPFTRISDDYAEKLLQLGTMVEVEYSANYIGNECLICPIRDSNSGIFFVHYLIEFDKFSVERHNADYITKLLANGRITDQQQRTIFQYERDVPIKLSKEQFDQSKNQKFSLADVFPLTEGSYKISILVKNEASKEFTSAETNIDIPDLYSLEMSDLILAYKAEQDLSSKMKAFKVDDVQFYPAVRRDFCFKDNLVVFLQILGLQDFNQTWFLRYMISNNGQAIKTLEKKIETNKKQETFIEQFSLTDFSPGYYKIRVSLLDEAKNEIRSRASSFSVSPVAALPRPWTNSIVHAAPENPVYKSILADQLLKKGELSKARSLAEQAYKLSPASLKLALSLSNILFMMKDYKSVIEILMPFYFDKKYEVLELLARSMHASGNLDKAISYYKEHLSHYGLSFHILSFLGECFYRSGDVEEALKAWEKSLELNPNQEEIKKIIDILKNRR